MRDRPVVVDVVLVVVSVVAMGVEAQALDTARPSGIGAVATVLAALPLLVRRRLPLVALGLALVGVVGVLSTTKTYNSVVVPAVICTYEVASRRGRRTAVLAGAVALPAVLLILQTFSPHSVLEWDTAKNLGLVALPLALGVAAHDRRRYTAVLLDRVAIAERSREEEARRRVGEERLRIARDVHDVVAHAMVAINVQAGVGAHLLERDPGRARATLRDIKKVSGDALADLRSMLGTLRDDDGSAGAPLAPVLGLPDLDDLYGSVTSAGVELDAQIDPEVGWLPVPVRATGYRIVQEAITNVMRHAGPTTARVRITRVEDGVLILVEDDGRRPGDHAAVQGAGLGVRGMRERAAAVGGSLEAGPRPGGGWRVLARLPTDGSGDLDFSPRAVTGAGGRWAPSSGS